MSLFDVLFEVPVSLLEAAVIQAQQRAPKPPLRERLQTSQVGALCRLLPSVVERGYGWTGAFVQRSAYRDEIEIVGRGRCGHLRKARFSERFAALAMSPVQTGDAIARAIVEAEQDRSCFCVPRPEPE